MGHLEAVRQIGAEALLCRSAAAASTAEAGPVKTIETSPSCPIVRYPRTIAQAGSIVRGSWR